MPFDFTFTIPVSLNPFAQAATQSQPEHSTESPNAEPSQARRHSSGTLAPSVGGRQRGWVPAPSRALEPNSLKAEAFGYVDAPSRYIGVAEDVAADLPPAKRRRTIGSTVADIINFALRRSEADMTAYEIWRDGVPTYTMPRSVSDGVLELFPPSENTEDPDSALMTRANGRNRSHRPMPTRSRRKQADLDPSLRQSASNPVSLLTSARDVSQPGAEETGDIDEQMVRMEARLQAMIEEGRRALAEDGEESYDDRDDIDESLGQREGVDVGNLVHQRHMPRRHEFRPLATGVKRRRGF